MRQTGQRIGLIHELAQLAAPEEILNHGGKRFGIHQPLRHQRPLVGVKQRHPLADQPLRARQPDTALVFQQFAHGAHPAAAEVVNIINVLFALADAHQMLDGGHHILDIQRAQIAIHLAVKPHTLVDLVPAHAPEVIPARIKEKPAQQLPRIRRRGRVTGPQAMINIFQRIIRGMGRIRLDAGQKDPAVPADIHHIHRLEPRVTHLLQRRRSERIKFTRKHGLGIQIHHITLEA